MSAHEMNNGRRQSGDYAALRSVLDEAFLQSAEGKGNARHANDKPFDKQPILEIGRMVGPGFAAGQVMKKAQEAIGMAARGETEAAANELLGAIVYAASAVVLVREKGVSYALAANAGLIEGWLRSEEKVAAVESAARLIEPEVAPRTFKVGDRVDLRSLESDPESERGKVTFIGDSQACVRWDRGSESWHPLSFLVHVD